MSSRSTFVFRTWIKDLYAFTNNTIMSVFRFTNAGGIFILPEEDTVFDEVACLSGS